MGRAVRRDEEATKPRRHNPIMMAQELLFVNRLFKLSDLLGIGFFEEGDSMEWGGERKGESSAVSGTKGEERSLGWLVGLKPSRYTSSARHSGDWRSRDRWECVLLRDGLSHKRTVLSVEIELSAYFFNHLRW